MLKAIRSLFVFLFGKTVLRLRLRSLIKNSAGLHRMNRSIQRSDLSQDLKLHSQALIDTYVKFVSLLSVSDFSDLSKDS